ncbi:MAG: D-tyrosyl-tRNA(Tyr) deacylase [Clostridia bacterium]|nr:D-tyrosyl-tRNA(Tyr) deacylase [Clostridia bacterium]
MRIVIQRVQYASCTVDGTCTGKIEKGYAALIGIKETDTTEIALKMLEKIKKLRIFEDENERINLNLEAVDGGILLIPQFTLYADCKSNRPGFTKAAPPDMAKGLFCYMVDHAPEYFDKVAAGWFGADMKIELLNDGPFTVILDSEELRMESK